MMCIPWWWSELRSHCGELEQSCGKLKQTTVTLFSSDLIVKIISPPASENSSLQLHRLPATIAF